MATAVKPQAEPNKKQYLGMLPSLRLSGNPARSASDKVLVADGNWKNIVESYPARKVDSPARQHLF